MDYIFSILGPTGYLVATIFLFIVAVLWFLIPFAIFGVKGLLKEMIAEQRRTNELLRTPSYAQPSSSEIGVKGESGKSWTGPTERR